MYRFLLRQIMVLALLIPAATAAQADAGLVTKQSPYGVGETLDRLEKVLTSKGITVFARIDHAAGAAKIGSELPATEVLLFGNPKLGTPLMQSNPTIGIDLPLKALVWEDSAGQVWLAYNQPAYLSDRHDIKDRDKVFANMNGALDNLTNAALKK